MNAKIDLRPQHLKIVQQLLAEQLHGDIKVWVFGSRATGKAKKYSDLDLALAANDRTRLAADLVLDLKYAFEESKLPYKVDVVDMAAVAKNFKRIIEPTRVPLAFDGSVMQKYLNKITQGDCIAVLKELPAQSVDLIFADPPYNLQLQGELYRPNQTKVAAVNDQWDQFNSFKDYDDFTSAWLTACKRVLKPNGAIWVIGSYHNIFRVGKIMQDIGLWILNDIVWIKTNPMPNFKGTRFNNAQETLIWAAKNKASKYTFHYKSMKAFNDDKQMRSDWYIPICNGTERLKENGIKVHSTQKPEALLFRVISATTKVGDIVLDPFMGSGTTAAVAKKLGRQYVGIEKETRYVNAAKKRVRYIRPLELDTLDYAIEVKQPRVPFGNLIESKLVRIGDYLYSENRKYKARILANATIKCSDKVGSIHKVSAQLLDKLSCNGWMFWYTQNKTGSLVLIDHLRTKYIQKYLID